MSIQVTIQHSPWLSSPAQGFLSGTEFSQLDAIFARLLPADPARHIPGARSADAANFVSRLLAMSFDVYFEIEGWRLFYPPALKALERYCSGQHGRPLTELSEAEMDSLIAGLERGALEGFSIADELAELAPDAMGRMSELVSQGRLTALNETNGRLDINQIVFFRTLLRHCLQGCFADPRWGGNKDKIIWRAMGYLQPPEDNLI